MTNASTRPAPEERPRLAVTGSTGRLGGRVARRLSEAGIQQRLLVRDPSRAPGLAGAHAERSDYGAADGRGEALEGVETLFMVSAAETLDRVDQHRAFVDAAAAAGVHHVVYTSFYGAALQATFTLARDHWVTEQYLRASGMSTTFLRDALYADFLPSLAGEDGVIRGPAGDGRVAAVVLDDIADAAVAVLLDPAAHSGATYDLTGPQALSFDEVAATITAVTGRGVTYHPETVEEAYVSRASYGAPAWQVDAWVSTYTAIAAGELAGVSTAVADLTERPATSLEAFLRSQT